MESTNASFIEGTFPLLGIWVNIILIVNMPHNSIRVLSKGLNIHSISTVLTTGYTYYLRQFSQTLFLNWGWMAYTKGSATTRVSPGCTGSPSSTTSCRPASILILILLKSCCYGFPFEYNTQRRPLHYFCCLYVSIPFVVGTMILNGLRSLDNTESLLRCSLHATYT